MHGDNNDAFRNPKLFYIDPKYSFGALRSIGRRKHKYIRKEFWDKQTENKKR